MPNKMKTEKKIVKQDFSLNLQAGQFEALSHEGSQTPILSGLFRFDDFQNGLSMHVSDAVEQRNTKIISELPAGISFNFLFDGTIDFIIGNQKYQLKKAANMMSHSNFIIVNKNEFFTRHLKQGMHIKKLNIFVEQAWLVKRCNNQADQRVMATFFQQPGVHQWQPDKDILQQAEALIKLNSPNAFGTKLISEQLVLGLLTACLEQAYKHLHHNDNQDASLEAFSTTLKDNVDQALTRCFSLPELANQLNMSVSTLQRHFKRDYGINISSYIKLRKLKQARRSLVVDNLSIGEVAFASGYNHVSNFIIAFKKQFGSNLSRLCQTTPNTLTPQK